MVALARTQEISGTISISRQPMPRQTACVGACWSVRCAARLWLATVYLVMRHLSGFRKAGVFHRLDDLVVSRTSAKIAGERLLNVGLQRMGLLFKQFGSGHDESRRAVPTLHRAVLDKR